jgi:ABC-type polysaccharide/polyol phosphate transport system ATPase subunit
LTRWWLAEVERFIDTPSSATPAACTCGCVAVAAHLELEILLVDEVLAVGDAAFQKAPRRMSDVAREAALSCSSATMPASKCAGGSSSWTAAGHLQGDR